MKAGVVSLVLSVLALGAGIVALTREAPRAERTSIRSSRVAELEQKVGALTREVETLKARQPGPGGAPPGGATEPADARVDGPEPDDGSALKAIVKDAVDRKAKEVIDEIKLKENKKPAIDVFARVLELSKDQRTATERIIVEGQRDVHEILDIPTADGRNLLDDLVEIMAKGLAQPGKDHGWGPWIARVLGEKIPGTNETYAARIEAVKIRMKQSFKQAWTKEQYNEFEAWGVDPTEVDKVPGSPNEQLGRRITETARRLGARIEDEPGN